MRRAVVIPGDGARGSFAAGVMMQMTSGVEAVYGTSSGAITAAAYSYGGPRGVLQFWSQMHGIRDFYAFSWLASLWRTGLFTTAPIRRKLERIADARQAPSFCEAVVSVTDMARGVGRAISNANVSRELFLDAVAASAAIPGAAALDANGWADGALRRLLPIDLAIDDGFEDIVVIMSRPFRRVFDCTWQRPRGPLAIVWSALRAVDLALHELLWLSLERAANRPELKRLTIYAPATCNMNLLRFNQTTIMDALRAGAASRPVFEKERADHRWPAPA